MLQSFQTHNLKKVAVSKEPGIHDKVSSMYFVSKATRLHATKSVFYERLCRKLETNLVGPNVGILLNLKLMRTSFFEHRTNLKVFIYW